MADPISFADCKIEYSENGSSFTDASGEANSVAISGGDRAVSEFFAPNSDVPKLTYGKRAALDVVVNVMYSEGATDVAEKARAAYEAGGDFYIQFEPKGDGVGNAIFTTSVGKVISPVYPQGDGGSADPMVVSIALKVAEITRTTQSA